MISLSSLGQFCQRFSTRQGKLEQPKKEKPRSRVQDCSNGHGDSPDEHETAFRMVRKECSIERGANFGAAEFTVHEQSTKFAPGPCSIWFLSYNCFSGVIVICAIRRKSGEDYNDG